MMERKMRRKDRQIGLEESREILVKGEYGVLATVDGEGQPYAVPLSYVYLDGNIYFHCALEGRKIDNLKANHRVSFAVVDQAEAVYDNGFSTYFESVIVFGPAREVTGDDEKRRSLNAIAEKYLPANMDKAEDYINHYYTRTAVWSIEPEVMTGKAKKKPRD